jgi:hypothetical protein
MSKYWSETLSKVEIIDVSQNGDVLKKLEQFDLDNAHCYNPK